MKQRGFTLLEVMIALAILAVSLAVLLESQASSLNNAGRSRDLTIATLLARSKMIDIEKQLFHDGFAMNTEENDGDFHDEGYPDVTWKSRVSEVELDLSALASLCGALTGGSHKKEQKKDSSSASGKDQSMDCESMLTGVGSMVGAFTTEMGHSMRVVDLKVTWPEGKFKSSMSVRALLTKDDYTTAVENLIKQQGLQNMQQNQSGQPGQPGQTQSPTTMPGTR